MAAAMPTVVADLGGLHLYSWSIPSICCPGGVAAHFRQTRRHSSAKTLYLAAIALFVLGSLAAGLRRAWVLIACRALQGIGAGGSFALVYVVLRTSPRRRPVLKPFPWGASSGAWRACWAPAWRVHRGPVSWRWIFFINVPLGALSMAGWRSACRDPQEEEGGDIDYAGALSRRSPSSVCLRCFWWRQIHDWASPHVAALGLITLMRGTGLPHRKARVGPDPAIGLFMVRGFSTGNGAVFLSSLTIFALFAFAPLSSRRL